MFLTYLRTDHDLNFVTNRLIFGPPTGFVRATFNGRLATSARNGTIAQQQPIVNACGAYNGGTVPPAYTAPAPAQLSAAASASSSSSWSASAATATASVAPASASASAVMASASRSARAASRRGAARSFAVRRRKRSSNDY